MSRFSKAAKKVTNTVSNVASKTTEAAKDAVKYPTRSIAAVGTGGLSLIPRALGGGGDQNFMDSFDKLYTAGAAATLGYGALAGPGIVAGASGGGAGAAGAAGAGGAHALAASGGLPLVSKILLGADVAATLAGYFGRKPGTDFQQYYNGLNDQEKKQVDDLKTNLTAIQSNVDMRTKAVTDLTDNYPQIMAQNLQEVSKTMGPEFDEIDKQVLNHAADQLSAKYQANGGFSSGAFNEGLAKQGIDLAIDRHQKLLDSANQVFSLKYNEANAQRNFQQTMLGKTQDAIFNADTNRINNLYGEAGNNANNANNRNLANNRATQDLFGGLGNTLGMGAIAFGGSRRPDVSASETPSMAQAPSPSPSWSGGNSDWVGGWG